MKHTISVLVENKFGVLARITTLFAARGFNIDSLAVGETEDPDVSRMTIVVKGDEAVLDQVTKQLNKLVDIIKVNDFKDVEYIERGLALVKITVKNATRDAIMKTIGVFRTRVVDLSQDSVVVEITGDEDKINAFIEAVKPFGIKEVCQTGIVAISRGK